MLHGAVLAIVPLREFLSICLDNGEIRLRNRVLSTDYTDFSKRGSCTCVICGRLRVPSQRRMESIIITTAATMMIAVRLVLMIPCVEVSGFCASGQKISVIDLKPATRVVVLTKESGKRVTHAYFAFPMFMRMVVATHKATAASSWLATPNIGQIVEIEPDQINAAQADTTSSEVITDP